MCVFVRQSRISALTSRVQFHEDVMDWELSTVEDDETIEKERANEWVLSDTVDLSYR